MIIVDFSQVMNANLFVAMKGSGPNEVGIKQLRPMVLHSLVTIKAKLSKDFGELVIACDSRVKSWRHEAFPYYKCRRAKKRSAIDLDWPAIHEAFAQIIEEIDQNFPYRVVRLDGAEADDIIGTLIHDEGDIFGQPGMENHVIVSTDQDFHQLPERYFNIYIYDHIKKKMVNSYKIEKDFLKRKILRGDVGDDVPNVLSQDDSFALGIRQKTLTEKKLTILLNANLPSEFPELVENFKRNQRLIDLSFTPEVIKEQIRVIYKEQAGKGRSRMFNYFVKNRLRDFTSNIQDF